MTRHWTLDDIPWADFDASKVDPELLRAVKAAALVDRSKRYPVDEAVKLLKQLPPVKFEESVELAVRIGIDPKKTDQLVRGSVTMPRGTGKKIKIAVFAEARRPRRPRRPAPTSSAARTSPRRSRRASSIST